MKPTLHLLYLDRYHQGDPLFLKELAQRFARTPPGEPPTLIVHGGGEKLERTLEAEGLFPEREEGVIVAETPRQKALAERAAREANQELVALFTDEEVSAVGLQGSDRGLLRVSRPGGGEDSTVEAGALGWVEDLVKMRVLPVVSALAEDASSGRARAVPPGRALLALAETLSDTFDVMPCFLAKGDLPEKESAAAAGALPEGLFDEPETLRRVTAAPRGALLTDLHGLFAEAGPQGVRVEQRQGA